MESSSSLIFLPNFDDFSMSGHHRNRLGADKVENRAQITSFCTKNIPTMLRVQFLSFPINTAIKYFGQILMTFPGPESTTAGKVENLAQMIWFCTKNIPTLFNVSCPYG